MEIEGRLDSTYRRRANRAPLVFGVVDPRIDLNRELPRLLDVSDVAPAKITADGTIVALELKIGWDRFLIASDNPTLGPWRVDTYGVVRAERIRQPTRFTTLILADWCFTRVDKKRPPFLEERRRSKAERRREWIRLLIKHMVPDPGQPRDHNGDFLIGDGLRHIVVRTASKSSTVVRANIYDPNRLIVYTYFSQQRMIEWSAITSIEFIYMEPSTRETHRRQMDAIERFERRESSTSD